MSKNEEQILALPTKSAYDTIVSHCNLRPTVSNLYGFFSVSDEVLPALQAASSFLPRGPAEEDPSQKQLIVYAVVSHQGRVLCYKRGKVGEEARLHAKRSIGVGGHINPEDWDLGADGTQAFRTALTRELEEEVGILHSHIEDVQLMGLVNEDETDVGKVHLGLVYLVSLKGIDGLKFEDALVDPQWCDEADLSRVENLEIWSNIVRAELCPQPQPTTLPDWAQRVVAEKENLDVKLAALTQFLGTEAFAGLPVAERERLIRQQHCMVEYSNVLGERIEAF